MNFARSYQRLIESYRLSPDVSAGQLKEILKRISWQKQSKANSCGPDSSTELREKGGAV